MGIKRVLTKLVAIVGLTAFMHAVPAQARGSLRGYAEQGGNTVSTGLFRSSTKVQQSFAGATVTVFAAGTTTLSSIFSDDSGTIKANPFTAGSDGSWQFYADDGSYDVKFSGTGITTPFTWSNLRLVSGVGTQSIFNVKDTPCGAVGNGAANDTVAFQTCTARLIANGGGTLYVPKGTYIVGAQTFAGVGGLGYAYRGQDIITISSVMPRPFNIVGDGAVLKMASGLKYGAFDPVTGNSSADVTGDLNKAGTLGIFIKILNQTVPFTISGFELDGNSSAQVIGGLWSSDGRQLDADGIMLADNQAQATVRDIYTHNNALDGIIVHQNTAVLASKENSTTLLLNLRSEANCRQALSWTGGHGLTAINCKFNFTGITTGGLGFTACPFTTAPGSGVDIEPAIGTLRNGLFMNCEFINNSGPGIVSDSGPDVANVTIMRSKIAGYVNYSLWIKQPFFTVRDCDIIGSTIWGYATTTPGGAGGTLWDNDYFHDETHPVYGVPFGTYLIQSDYGGINAYGQMWRNCTVVATNHLATFIRTNVVRGFSFEGVVRQIFTPVAANTALDTFTNVAVRNSAFYNGMTAPPAGLHVDGGGGSAGIAEGQVFVDTNISWGFATGLTNLYVPQTNQTGFKLNSILFANLNPTFGNGTIYYCSDCTVAATCAGAGSGAIAKRLNGVWVCN